MDKIDKIITESINHFLLKENWIDDMVRAKHEAINNSPLGIIKKALPDVNWTISGDYGYKCIKDYQNSREFRLYRNGDLYFLYGYDENSGAWGDYAHEVKIDNLEELMQQPTWYRNLYGGKTKASKHQPNVIIGR